MDLRSKSIPDSAIETAARVLNYQPFFVTPELQTGVAYSILHSKDPRVSPPLVFRRSEWSEEDWKKITESNSQMRTMYDIFVREIATRYQGKSLFDVACNNGYIPVAAEVAGMKDCAGMDLGPQHADSIAFLNRYLGTGVRFLPRHYSPELRTAGKVPSYDVIYVSAIMCHLPDPLNFLAWIGSLAREAVFFWGQVIDHEQFVVSYKEPHPNLGTEIRFPYHFNDNTRITLALFRHAMQSMGFPNMTEIRYPPWIPENPDLGLDSQLTRGSRHRALLFTR